MHGDAEEREAKSNTTHTEEGYTIEHKLDVAELRIDLGEKIHLRSMVMAKCEQEVPFAIGAADELIHAKRAELEDSGDCASRKSRKTGCAYTAKKTPALINLSTFTRLPTKSHLIFLNWWSIDMQNITIVGVTITPNPVETGQSFIISCYVRLSTATAFLKRLTMRH